MSAVRNTLASTSCSPAWQRISGLSKSGAVPPPSSTTLNIESFMGSSCLPFPLVMPQSPSFAPITPRRQVRGEEPDRNTNQDWPNTQRKPLRPGAHIGKMQSADQHSDPKQIIDKLNCSHHRHILAQILGCGVGFAQ